VIVDVLRHFLTKKLGYSDERRLYTALYQTLTITEKSLQKTICLMPYMIKQNWLLSYQTVSGIDGILTQMDSRTKK
jgi:acyl carrier protein phosphodiesterase